MRGLEEIRSRNENPHGFHGDSNEVEQHGNAPRRHTSPEETQRFHGERVEERQRVNGRHDPLNELDRSHRASQKDRVNPADLLALLVIGAAIEDAARPRTLADRPRGHTRHAGMDGILSAIDCQPPFIKFWAGLNDERASKGFDEALYGEAKEAFNGGPTPLGALTFVGKEWNGLRAIPVRAVQGQKTYHGEFSQTAEDGSTVWRVVANGSGHSIDYASPEAAINGARHAKTHSEAHKS